MRKLGVLTMVGVVTAVAVVAALWLRHRPLDDVAQILAAYDVARQYDRLAITYPLAGTLFPPEIAVPTFQWQDPGTADRWLATISLADGSARVERPVRTPAMDACRGAVGRHSQRIGGATGQGDGLGCARGGRPYDSRGRQHFDSHVAGSGGRPHSVPGS